MAAKMWTYQLASIKIPVERYLNYLCAKMHNFIQKCTPYYLRAPTKYSGGKLIVTLVKSKCGSCLLVKWAVTAFWLCIGGKPVRWVLVDYVYSIYRKFTWNVDSILVYYWASVVDGGRTLKHHWVNVPCLLLLFIDCTSPRLCIPYTSLMLPSLIFCVHGPLWS